MQIKLVIEERDMWDVNLSEQDIEHIDRFVDSIRQHESRVVNPSHLQRVSDISNAEQGSQNIVQRVFDYLTSGTQSLTMVEIYAILVEIGGEVPIELETQVCLCAPRIASVYKLRNVDLRMFLDDMLVLSQNIPDMVHAFRLLRGCGAFSFNEGLLLAAIDNCIGPIVKIYKNNAQDFVCHLLAFGKSLEEVCKLVVRAQQIDAAFNLSNIYIPNLKVQFSQSVPELDLEQSDVTHITQLVEATRANNNHLSGDDHLQAVIQLLTQGKGNQVAQSIMNYITSERRHSTLGQVYVVILRMKILGVDFAFDELDLKIKTQSIPRIYEANDEGVRCVISDWFLLGQDIPSLTKAIGSLKQIGYLAETRNQQIMSYALENVCGLGRAYGCIRKLQILVEDLFLLNIQYTFSEIKECIKKIQNKGFYRDVVGNGFKEMEEGYIDAAFILAMQASRKFQDRYARVRDKELNLILGDSGAGKTTTYHLITGGILDIGGEGGNNIILSRYQQDDARVYETIGVGAIRATQYPNIRIDNQKAWCDCPGFANTTLAQELFYHYSIKNLLYEASSLRAILVVLDGRSMNINNHHGETFINSINRLGNLVGRSSINNMYYLINHIGWHKRENRRQEEQEALKQSIKTIYAAWNTDAAGQDRGGVGPHTLDIVQDIIQNFDRKVILSYRPYKDRRISPPTTVIKTKATDITSVIERVHLIETQSMNIQLTLSDTALLNLITIVNYISMSLSDFFADILEIVKEDITLGRDLENSRLRLQYIQDFHQNNSALEELPTLFRQLVYPGDDQQDEEKERQINRLQGHISLLKTFLEIETHNTKHSVSSLTDRVVKVDKLYLYNEFIEYIPYFVNSMIADIPSFFADVLKEFQEENNKNTLQVSSLRLEYIQGFHQNHNTLEALPMLFKQLVYPGDDQQDEAKERQIAQLKEHVLVLNRFLEIESYNTPSSVSTRPTGRVIDIDGLYLYNKFIEYVPYFINSTIAVIPSFFADVLKEFQEENNKNTLQVSSVRLEYIQGFHQNHNTLEALPMLFKQLVYPSDDQQNHQLIIAKLNGLLDKQNIVSIVLNKILESGNVQQDEERVQQVDHIQQGILELKAFLDHNDSHKISSSLEQFYFYNRYKQQIDQLQEHITVLEKLLKIDTGNGHHKVDVAKLYMYNEFMECLPQLIHKTSTHIYGLFDNVLKTLKKEAVFGQVVPMNSLRLEYIQKCNNSNVLEGLPILFKQLIYPKLDIQEQQMVQIREHLSGSRTFLDVDIIKGLSHLFVETYSNGMKSRDNQEQQFMQMQEHLFGSRTFLDVNIVEGLSSLFREIIYSGDQQQKKGKEQQIDELQKSVLMLERWLQIGEYHNKTLAQKLPLGTMDVAQLYSHHLFIELLNNQINIENRINNLVNGISIVVNQWADDLVLLNKLVNDKIFYNINSIDTLMVQINNFVTDTNIVFDLQYFQNYVNVYDQDIIKYTSDQYHKSVITCFQKLHESLLEERNWYNHLSKVQDHLVHNPLIGPNTIENEAAFSVFLQDRGVDNADDLFSAKRLQQLNQLIDEVQKRNPIIEMLNIEQQNVLCVKADVTTVENINLKINEYTNNHPDTVYNHVVILAFYVLCNQNISLPGKALFLITYRLFLNKEEFRISTKGLDAESVRIKAGVGRYPGLIGEHHGLPGQEGSNGHNGGEVHLRQLSNEELDQKHIIVDTSGGNAANGQGGGDGLPGSNGGNAGIPDRSGDDYIISEKTENGVNIITYIRYGTRGQDGGGGGKGGRGGLGGQAGICTTSNIEIKLTNNVGKDGICGKQGTPSEICGRGGLARVRSCMYQNNNKDGIWIEHSELIMDNHKADCGQKGHIIEFNKNTGNEEQQHNERVKFLSFLQVFNGCHGMLGDGRLFAYLMKPKIVESSTMIDGTLESNNCTREWAKLVTQDVIDQCNHVRYT